jgi:hypothetical protein
MSELDNPDWIEQIVRERTAALRDALEQARGSNDHYVAEFNRVMEERDAAYDDRAEAIRAKCEAIARERVERGITTEVDERAEEIADAIASLKGKP